MFEKVTIKDIAQKVGVSKATISYYLNGNFHKMSYETKEMIRRVIEETGYKPSSIAKGLATRDTKTIGVVIADITNPFITFVMKGISDTCKLLGYTVKFTNSDNDVRTEVDNLNRLFQEEVSGVLLDSVDPNHPMIATLQNHNVVMLDRQSKHLTVDTVVSDNRSSTSEFIRQMKAAGYDDIYFVSFPIEGISTRELRYQGFLDVVGHQKTTNHVLILGQDDFSQRVKTIMETATKPPAFFTMNGPTLLSFMKLIGEMGYAYPQDFGLGTYEHLDWMELLNPGISCISQDSYRIGKVAVERLVDKLQVEQDLSPRILTVTNAIIIKESF